MLFWIHCCCCFDFFFSSVLSQDSTFRMLKFINKQSPFLRPANTSLVVLHGFLWKLVLNYSWRNCCCLKKDFIPQKEPRGFYSFWNEAQICFERKKIGKSKTTTKIPADMNIHTVTSAWIKENIFFLPHNGSSMHVIT